MTQAGIPLQEGQPLCPEGDLKFWAGVGAGAMLVLSAGYLLGLSGLFRGTWPEGVHVLARVSAVLSNAVWMALCTGAGALAIAAVAIVRVRRPGAFLDIVCRVFACVSVANLVHFMPIHQPVWKLVWDVGAFLVSVALLGRAAFRLPMLDATAAVAVASGAVAALTAVAYAVVWAVLPK